jgi:hypothetical protein
MNIQWSVRAFLALGAAAGISLVLVAGSQVLSAPTGVAGPSWDPAARALEVVASREGVPIADLEVVNAAKATYREQGVTLDSFKVYDRVRDELHLVSLDRDGREVDPEAVAVADLQLARDRRGALDTILAAKIDAASPGDHFDVVITVSAPSNPAPAPTGQISQAEVEAFRAAATARRRAEVSAALAPMIALLQAKGVHPIALTDAPFLYARLTAADIRELSRAPGVVQIGLTRP